jgi:MFS family permease
MVVGVATLVAASATALAPLAARVNVAAFIGLRLLLGIALGASSPAGQQIWSRWVPPLERSFLTSLAFSGAQIGNVLVMPLTGLLCKYGFDGGWPSIFYLFGALGLAYTGLWFYAVADTPMKHKRIGEEERNYIVKALEDCVEKEDTVRKFLFCWIKLFFLNFNGFAQ